MNNNHITSDIHDNPKDLHKLQPEEVILDLPEVKDIPGQEHIHVPHFGEMADTTISSADEEGRTIKGFADDEEDSDATISDEELELLDRTVDSNDSDEDDQLRHATLDNTDEDGDPLNESVGVSGEDLDVPGAEDDDDNEAIGEEDEENNTYSLGGQDQ